jgi:hypothetical protein
MIDTVTLAKARTEIGRLNRELAELHLEEERCKLRRTRLEGEKAKVQALVDMVELMQRLVQTPADPATPSFHIETVAGAKVVIVDKPVAPTTPTQRHKLKPNGLPSTSTMIVMALQASGKAQRPVEIADYVRNRWWPTLATPVINTQVWHMAKIGKLTCRDGYYGLNGIGHVRGMTNGLE